MPGVRALLADGSAHGRWKVSQVDITDTAATKEAAWAADLLWLESPTNPLIDIADLPELCRFGTGTGALVVVDNTFATPLGQRPLGLGADVVLHSATKFIGGHSDLLLGLAVTADPELATPARDPPLARRCSTRRARGISGPPRVADDGDPARPLAGIRPGCSRSDCRRTPP